MDFHEYKASTLARQCARRQALTGTMELPAYRDLVVSDVQEARALAQSLQVGVTSFFRDPDVWTALGRALDGVVRTDRQYRVWVPGCATGEEAYTVAMTVAAACGAGADLPLRVKLFATDLSEPALEVARRGRYGADVADGIPPELRERWMHRDGHHWVVDPALREAVVFARHNVAQDPPFPQIDLVTLRNTLIYFKPSLQQRVLEMCHFALVPEGLLVLGASERVGARKTMFAPVDDGHRIYARVPGPSRQTWTLKQPAVSEARSVGSLGEQADEPARLLTALVTAYVPAGFVVDADGEVLEVFGDVSPWSRLSPGQLTSNVVPLLLDELRQPARQLLVQAKHASPSGVARDLIGPGGPVRLTARSIGPAESGWQVLTFTDSPAPATPGGDEDATTSVARAELDRIALDLEITQNALQSTIEELGTSNEELRAANEELQASAEEIQASTEEVQASNEELEATNEELTTLNADLQARGDDLARANTELENVQSSLTSGLVIVDRDLAIARFTPLAVRLFPLIDSDVGRALTSIHATVPVTGLERGLRACITERESTTLEVSGDAQDFLVQIAPYVLADRSVAGAVVTISDVTDLSSAKRQAASALADFAAVTDALRETVWQRDSSGALLFLNTAVERLYGLSRAHVLADPHLLVAAVHPDDRDRVLAATAGGRWNLQYRIVRPDGTMRWVEESALEVPPTDLHRGYIVGSVLDVTERVDAETQARQLRQDAARQTELLDATMSTSYLGVVVLDADGRILRANRAFADLSGITSRSVIGTPLASLIPNFDGPDDADAIQTMWFRTGVVHRRMLTRDGRDLWVAVASSPVETTDDEQPADRVVTVDDLTRVREQAGELATQARFDQHTGALTRAHFRDRLTDELARAGRTGRGVAVLWLDLDGFKDVNDRHGHRSGDTVLVEVASRLASAARRQDCVGRLGGDEFAMIVTDFTNPDSLEAVAARVLATLRNPIAGPDGPLQITGSIGVAIGPADGSDADALMHSADTAMYVAKAAGRDTHAFFQSPMNEAAERGASRRHDLAEAIRATSFEMAYQPVIELTSGRLVMAEALVRWQRDGDLVPAGQFMDVVQDSGHLRALGQIVLGLVDADLAVLDAASDLTALPAAINVSPEELDGRDLVNRAMDWEPPGGFGRIVIEVTESTLMAYQGRAMEALGLMRRLGATIAIDDFGTGFSNLAMLERLQPDIIKIDRSLLVSADDNSRSMSILGAAIGLGHALESRVVVEGIETQHQRDLVATLGADLGQGYFFARPMPLRELIGWSSSHARGE
jgi:two-component system CheB/CheR fusion protein